MPKPHVTTLVFALILGLIMLALYHMVIAKK